MMGREARLVAEGGKVVAVEVDGGRTVVADNYVVCAGYNSLKISQDNFFSLYSFFSPDNFFSLVCAGYNSLSILRNLGLSIPLLPIKAYSLHINNCPPAKNWR